MPDPGRTRSATGCRRGGVGEATGVSSNVLPLRGVAGHSIITNEDVPAHSALLPEGLVRLPRPLRRRRRMILAGGFRGAVATGRAGDPCSLPSEEGAVDAAGEMGTDWRGRSVLLFLLDDFAAALASLSLDADVAERRRRLVVRVDEVGSRSCLTRLLSPSNAASPSWSTRMEPIGSAWYGSTRLLEPSGVISWSCLMRLAPSNAASPSWSTSSVRRAAASFSTESRPRAATSAARG